MAFAGARFANSLLLAKAGEPVTECAFVASNVQEGARYFSNPIKLGVSSSPLHTTQAVVRTPTQLCVLVCHIVAPTSAV